MNLENVEKLLEETREAADFQRVSGVICCHQCALQASCIVGLLVYQIILFLSCLQIYSKLVISLVDPWLAKTIKLLKMSLIKCSRYASVTSIRLFLTWLLNAISSCHLGPGTRTSTRSHGWNFYWWEWRYKRHTERYVQRESMRICAEIESQFFASILQPGGQKLGRHGNGNQCLPRNASTIPNFIFVGKSCVVPKHSLWEFWLTETLWFRWTNPVQTLHCLNIMRTTSFT